MKSSEKKNIFLKKLFVAKPPFPQGHWEYCMQKDQITVTFNILTVNNEIELVQTMSWMYGMN